MEIKKNSPVFKRGTMLRALLLVYDVFVVNFAYYIAVLLRFTDAGSFRKYGIRFMDKFKDFALWYTLGCLVLFILFHLYSGVWRYAGFNDFKKLALVNVCTCTFYVCGSLIIVGRMPITVYTIGAFFQFFMMGLARLAPRYILEGQGKSSKGKKDEVAIPLMIVGIGENTRIIQSKIARDRTKIVKPVCVIDYDYGLQGKSFNGLPVLSGLDGVKKAIEKYGIRCVIIAEGSLPREFIESIREICDKENIELRDFMIGTEFRARFIGIRQLLEAAGSPVVISSGDGEEKRFETGRDALRSFREDVAVEEVSVSDGALRIKLGGPEKEKDEAGEEWIAKYREEMGSDVSFF